MKLYVYDHCPYCVKARMIFGYKNIPFELITLLNDDEHTPISMINQKMLPILSDNDEYTPESLDIISKIDATTEKPFLSAAPLCETLQSWLADSRVFLYPLAMPRWVQADLDEFKTSGAKNYFTKKKEAYIGPFKEHMSKTKIYIEQANAHLLKLELLLNESSFYIKDEPSLNDIDLFATLRSLSIVKGLVYPKKVLSYMKRQEELSQVPLHLNTAL